MKGASERLQPPESLIWENGTGMQPQAWSQGRGAVQGIRQDRRESCGKWYLKLNEIVGTAGATLCFSMPVACIPLHLGEGRLPIKIHCNLVINGSLEPKLPLKGWRVSLYIWDQTAACATTKGDSLSTENMTNQHFSMIQAQICCLFFSLLSEGR